MVILSSSCGSGRLGAGERCRRAINKIPICSLTAHFLPPSKHANLESCRHVYVHLQLVDFCACCTPKLFTGTILFTKLKFVWLVVLYDASMPSFHRYYVYTYLRIVALSSVSPSIYSTPDGMGGILPPPPALDESEEDSNPSRSCL